MRRGMVASAVAAAIAVAIATVTPAAARSRQADVSPAGFVTVMMGRSMWAQSQRCQQVGPDLLTVAGLLALRGVRVTGMVVPARTAESGVQCLNGNLYPSWAELAQLRDQFGWTFVSNGQRRTNITKLDPPGQRAESCGSLAAFAAHGHTARLGHVRAWLQPHHRRHRHLARR